MKKSLTAAHEKYAELGLSEEKCAEQAEKDVIRELEQGFQSLELKLNTVPCSRGDFAFTTLTFGQWSVDWSAEDRKWMRLIDQTILATRRNGHGPSRKLPQTTKRRNASLMRRRSRRIRKVRRFLIRR